MTPAQIAESLAESMNSHGFNINLYDNYEQVFNALILTARTLSKLLAWVDEPPSFYAHIEVEWIQPIYQGEDIGKPILRVSTHT